MKKVSKKRDEYKPLLWLPAETYLQILIFKNYTIVKSEIYFVKT